MPKKNFEGEGNPTSFQIYENKDFKPEPSEPTGIKGKSELGELVVTLGTSVLITDAERVVLKTILDRDRTSRIVHGGLKSLLQLSDEEVKALLGFLDRI